MRMGRTRAVDASPPSQITQVSHNFTLDDEVFILNVGAARRRAEITL